MKHKTRKVFCISSEVAILRPLGYLVLRQGIQWGDTNLAFPAVARLESGPGDCIHYLKCIHSPLFLALSESRGSAGVRAAGS